MAHPFKDVNFEELFDAAADAMLLVDSTGHVIQANSAAQQLLEYSKKEICGLEVEALIPASFRNYHHQHRSAFFEKPEKRSMGNGKDLFALSKSGKELAVSIGLSPIKTQQQLFILITFYSADKRHNAEQALRTSEERLRIAKQAANLGVFDYDIQLNIVHWDERMCELWGEKSSESIKYKKFISTVHPNDRAVIQVAMDRAINPANNDGFLAEFRILSPNSDAERWVTTTGRVYFEDGHATRLVGVAQDVTELKKLEKNLQEQRAETESVFKQQVAAQTASAIAHELNQPLAAISAYSEVALHALNEFGHNPSTLKRALEGCVAQAQRAGTNLHELLAFLQAGELITERLDINDAVKEAVNIARRDGYKEFALKLKLEQNMSTVLANRIQVQKVLVNLLRNAVEAMRGAGIPNSAITITVRTNKDMNMAHITVQDSGYGLDTETAKRVFEPFFTTKPTGIGMGLAVSRALAEANGGQLWLEPNKRPGATFHFTLPFAP